MRVVSLLPSATELLCALGAGDLLVARSHECDHPREIADRPVLTAARTRYTTAREVDDAVRDALTNHSSLYTLDEDRLRSLAPDLILTQDLCAVCSIDLGAVRRVAASLDPAPEVLSLDPHTIEDVYDDALRLGALLGREQAARELVVSLRERFHRASDHVNPYADKPTVVFLEWTDPPYIAGHWTPQLIHRAGALHPLNPPEDAGPAPKSIAVPPEAIGAIDPDIVLVCPCGLTLEQTRTEARRLLGQDWFASLRAVAAGRAAIIDGNQMFNRPGPRLVDAFEFLVAHCNDVPRLIPPAFPWEPLPT